MRHRRSRRCLSRSAAYPPAGAIGRLARCRGAGGSPIVKAVRGVTGARLRNLQTNTVEEVAVHGIFIAIGHAPATELFQGKLEMQENGYLITAPDSTATNVAGVYAAGDVTDETYRQAVTAAGMGCMAALEAERYLEERHAQDPALVA